MLSSGIQMFGRNFKSLQIRSRAFCDCLNMLGDLLGHVDEHNRLQWLEVHWNTQLVS